MIKTLLVITLRKMRREKDYATIHILGLTLGIACSILFFSYAIDELSHDRYHLNAENIYRIVMHANETDDESTWARTQIPLADELAEKHPEVKNLVRFFTTGRELFQKGNTKFYEENFYFTDSSVFDMFTYEFIAGDSKTALQEPYSIVITESLAKKYFGNDDSLGKHILYVDRNENYIVTGIIKDVPSNTPLDFDALMSANCLPMFRQQEDCGGMMVIAYIQLSKRYPDHN